MSTPIHFLPAEEIRTRAGEAASPVLPIQDGATLPVPRRADAPGELLVMYYRAVGRPGHLVVSPPHYAIVLDGATGKVLRQGPTTPGQLGIAEPIKPVPGVGETPVPVDDLIDKRDRFLEISPRVWEAFASGSKTLDPATKALVGEYWRLFKEITAKEIAPFYLGAAPDFFDWVKAVASAP